MKDMNVLVEMNLANEEVLLVNEALSQWGGSAKVTEQFAIAMGFLGYEDFMEHKRRLSGSLSNRMILSRQDWTRLLVATEIVFVSDVVGAGVEWQTVTGLEDQDTLTILRGLQRRLVSAYVRDALG